MIGRTVSLFGRAAVRGRARNTLIRGEENAPGTVCINSLFEFINLW